VAAADRPAGPVRTHRGYDGSIVGAMAARAARWEAGIVDDINLIWPYSATDLTAKSWHGDSVEFRILGPLEVAAGGGGVRPGGPPPGGALGAPCVVASS